MVGAFKLVLDDDGAVVAVLGVDIEAEVADPHFGGDDGRSHFEGVGEDVDVFGEPRGEVPGLGGPDRSGVRDAAEPAQVLAVEFVHVDSPPLPRTSFVVGSAYGRPPSAGAVHDRNEPVCVADRSQPRTGTAATAVTNARFRQHQCSGLRRARCAAKTTTSPALRGRQVGTHELGDRRAPRRPHGTRPREDPRSLAAGAAASATERPRHVGHDEAPDDCSRPYSPCARGDGVWALARFFPRSGSTSPGVR